MRRQGAVIGLLIAAIFVGSIDVAMRAYSAIGTQPKTEKVVPVKIQDRLIAVVADSQEAIQTSISPGAVKPQTSDPSANPGSDIRRGVQRQQHPPNGRFCYSPCGAPAPCIFDASEFSLELNSCVAIENCCGTSFSFSAHEKAQKANS